MKRYLCNIGFWELYIRSQFINQIELLYESIQNRLIPTFDTIEKEAEEISKKEYNRLCSSLYSPDIDLADIAERAEEAGIEYYMSLSGIKQTLLNITATALYHLFEQQITFFLRLEVLPPAQENHTKLMKVSTFEEELRKKGINIRSFCSWNKIEELRIVANTIKHAEGRAASDLRRRRPDLFKPQSIKSFSYGTPISRIYMPLAGEDIFVTKGDLLKYKNVLTDFWIEFIDTCLKYKDNQAT